MISSSQEEYDKSAVNSFNTFDFVSSSFKGMYIQIPRYNVEEKYIQHKNLANAATAFDQLMIDLNKSSRDHGGFEIYSNGQNSNLSNERKIRCYRFNVYKPHFNTKDGREGTFRVDLLCNKRQKNCLDRKTLSRRSRTKLTIKKEH